MKIKEKWVSWEELQELLDSGLTPSSAIDASTVGGLAAGSIPFADASGFLTENNAALFWDSANEILKITSATSILIGLYPGFTGTGHVFEITPSAVIDTVDAVWEGIIIDCTALDPSVIGVEIHGMYIDLSGVDQTNNPHSDCLHLLSASALGGDHALHADGEIHIDIDATPAAPGEEYTALDVIIATVGSTGGDMHVLDVARSGAGSIGIAAIGTHEGIDVLHQAIGTFAAADKIWEYDNDGPGWTDVTAGVVSIWDDKDDIIYVGHASTFSEIKFIFSVVATKNMHFKFYFSEGGAVWTEFFPADDTMGATQNGSVRYTASALAAWAVDTVNGEANKYWIRIDRTRTSGTGPTATSMQQLAPTLYSWDKLGAITALSLSASQITDTGVTVTNIAAGTTGQRPGGTVGDIRYNSTLGEYELYIAAWHNIARGGANVVFGTIGTSGQIKFPAVQSASADANTLDDYEEGTFTPYVYDAPTGGNQGGSGTATYTKIGNMVSVNIFFSNVSTAGLTGGNIVYIRELPFTLRAGADSIGALSARVITINNSYLVAKAFANTTYCALHDVQSGANGASVIVSALTSGSADFSFSLIYQV